MIYKLFRNVALAGNILFVLWMLYNGIDDGFRGTAYQIMSYISLTLLLGLNSILHFYHFNRNIK
jgi:hypothetical protein